MTDIRKTLCMTLESPYYDHAYEKALSEDALPEWLTEEYVCALADEFGILRGTRDVALQVLPHVVCVPELCLMAKTIYHILDTRKKYSEAFTALSFPTAPEGTENAVGYDCFVVFPVLAHAKKTWDELVARGVDKDVAADSVSWTDSFFAEATKDCGKPCYPKGYFAAYGVGIYVDSLIVGRLRFEICEHAKATVRIFQNTKGETLPIMDNTRIHPSGHVLGTYGAEDDTFAYEADFKETDDGYEGYTVDATTRLVVKERVKLPKNEWKQVFQPGDTVMKVHIPRGGSMTPAAVADSYARAKEIFTRCYPEYHVTSYRIGCWMLSPVLKEILSPTSNIVAFAEDFTVFPIENNARDAFLYVFGIKGKTIPEIDFASLPEENSMQRGIKKKALEGELVYQFGGYRPW